jgi:hypothetical protein
LSRISGPPIPNAGTQRSVEFLRPDLDSAIHALGMSSIRNPPARRFVPARLTALVTMPVARPNSALMAPRFTLNSTMSYSLTSVER